MKFLLAIFLAWPTMGFAMQDNAKEKLSKAHQQQGELTNCSTCITVNIPVIEKQTLEQFLASIEQRAYRRVVIATGKRDDAQIVVQDAMTKLM